MQNKNEKKKSTPFFMYDVDNGAIKLGNKCTIVLSEYERYLATDCTDALSHYMESLICMNIWSRIKEVHSVSWI